MVKYLLLVLIGVGSFKMYAQSNPPNDSTTQVMEEILVESSLLEETALSYAGSLSIVDLERMESSDGVNYQPLLNSIPGVFMQSGALNTNRITIRGMGARSPFATNKIKAYLNDIPLTSGDGETAIEDVDLSSLKGIEVYRGPVASQFGAGLGGAIHLLANNLVKENQVGLKTSIQSFGLQALNLKAKLSTKKGGLHLFYQKVHSDGYRDNNEYDRTSISLIGQAKLGARNTLTAYANYTDLLAQIPGALDVDDYRENPREAAFIWARDEGQEAQKKIRMGLSMNTSWHRQIESTVAIYMNHSDAREITPISSIGIEEVNQLNFGLRAKIKGDFFDQKLSAVIGIETMNEDYDQVNYVNNQSLNGDLMNMVNQQRNYVNIFFSSKYKLNTKWCIEVGSNFNWSQFDVTDIHPAASNALRNHQFDPQWSPKFMINRQLGSSIVYVSVAQGFSLPSFEDTLSPDHQVNNLLEPETGWNYELGAKGRTNWHLSYQLALYSMQVKNLLVSRSDAEGAVYSINAGSTIHNGVELELNHLLTETRKLTLDHQLSLAFMNYKFDSFVDSEDGDFSTNDLTGIPSHTINYLIKGKLLSGWFAQVNASSIGEMPLNDANSEYAQAYQLLNYKMGYDRKFGHYALRIALGVNNVLDQKYAAMISINAQGFGGSLPRYYYPGLPRNFEAALNLTYAF